MMMMMMMIVDSLSDGVWDLFDRTRHYFYRKMVCL